ISCTLSPSCSLLDPFETAAAYEAHYAEMHQNVCATCRRVLPTSRLLDLHLSECHDSFFSVLADRQNMVCYECFVETCSKKCATPRKRNRHLIHRHKFPSDFDFGVILGVDPRSAKSVKSGSAGGRRGGVRKREDGAGQKGVEKMEMDEDEHSKGGRTR
ncbi:hypothetical protein BDK51DRAFT_20726, partial [Blyttiomyces helicus]